MISISHWGQFPTDAIEHLAPQGYRFSDHDSEEWGRLDGMIEVKPTWFDRGDGLPSYWDRLKGGTAAGLKSWNSRLAGEQRIAQACRAVR